MAIKELKIRDNGTLENLANSDCLILIILLSYFIFSNYVVLLHIAPNV